MSFYAYFLLAIVVVITVTDVVLISYKGKRSSISAWAIRTSYKYPSLVAVFCLALGFVLGHLFWRMKTLDIYECDAPEVKEILLECSAMSDDYETGRLEYVRYNKNKKNLKE